MQSDLIGLRAELQKKRVEVSKYGGGGRGISNRIKKNTSKSTSFNIQNAGLAIREAKDKQQQEEESPSIEKARSILERKAQLYEKLHSGIETLEDDVLNEKYLVNFQRKIVDDVAEKKRQRENERVLKEEEKRSEELQPGDCKAKGRKEEWVEYTDVLGRTRKCMKKDLPSMVDNDKNLLGENQDESDREEELLSGEKYREKLHEKWDREAEINALKKDVHYQDVLYDEARVHGIGFMKFSSDEKERKEQMDMLKEMHEEASRSGEVKKAAFSRNQKLLQARLEKVRQRKRLKLGLPIKDDSRLKTPPASDEEEEEIISLPNPSQELPEDSKEDATLKPKQSKTREWDLGKQGVRGSLLSQEEWLDQERAQRISEFAPPSTYSSNKEHKSHSLPSTSAKKSSVTKIFHESSVEYNQKKQNNEFAPPPTYDYYGPTSIRSRKTSKKIYRSIEKAFVKGLSNMQNMSNQ